MSLPTLAALEAEAAKLQVAANAYWTAVLGDPGLLGGFQVEPVGGHKDGRMVFVSTLYGGRRVIGDSKAIAEACSNYVESRRRGKAAA